MEAREEFESESPDYADRLAQNIRWLAQQIGWTEKRVLGAADIAKSAVQKWRKGDASPTLRKLQDLGEVLGVEATDLLLPHDDLVLKVATEGLRPFVRGPVVSSSSRSISGDSEESGAASKERFRAKNPAKRSGKTGTEGASSRWSGQLSVRPACSRSTSWRRCASTYMKRTPAPSSTISRGVPVTHVSGIAA